MIVSGRMATVIERLAGVPLVGIWLRRAARLYPEGSVVPIPTGAAAGLRWRRRHRFVSGYWLGSYEWPVQSRLAGLLGPGDVLYDVGAHAGFFSLIAARAVGPGGAVYAFEPLADHRAVIEEQLALNGFGNCTIVPAAVAAERGPALLALREGASAEARLTSDPTGAAGGARLPVEAVTLDDFVAAGHRPPDVIKIDVEGEGHGVLRGCREVLLRHRPGLLLELHDEEERREAEAILSRAGYVLEPIAVRAAAAPGAPCHVEARHPQRPARREVARQQRSSL
jgi:FkbM family methyltransferase